EIDGVEGFIILSVEGKAHETSSGGIGAFQVEFDHPVPEINVLQPEQSVARLVPVQVCIPVFVVDFPVMCVEMIWAEYDCCLILRGCGTAVHKEKNNDVDSVFFHDFDIFETNIAC